MCVCLISLESTRSSKLRLSIQTHTHTTCRERESLNCIVQKRKVYIEIVQMDVAQLDRLPNGDPRVMC